MLKFRIASSANLKIGKLSLSYQFQIFKGYLRIKFVQKSNWFEVNSLFLKGFITQKNQEEGNFDILFQSKIELIQKISSHPAKMEQKRINFTANVFTF